MSLSRQDLEVLSQEHQHIKRPLALLSSVDHEDDLGVGGLLLQIAANAALLSSVAISIKVIERALVLLKLFGHAYFR